MQYALIILGNGPNYKFQLDVLQQLNRKNIRHIYGIDHGCNLAIAYSQGNLKRPLFKKYPKIDWRKSCNIPVTLSCVDKKTNTLYYLRHNEIDFRHKFKQLQSGSLKQTNPLSRPIKDLHPMILILFARPLKGASANKFDNLYHEVVIQDIKTCQYKNRGIDKKVTLLCLYPDSFKYKKEEADNLLRRIQFAYQFKGGI